MRNPFASSIRAKLVLLLLSAFLPVVLLIVLNSWHQRKAEIAAAKDRMAKVLDFAVLHEEDVIRQTHRILAMLADVPVVRRGKEPASEFLARFLKKSPEYTNFGVLRPDGQVVASAVPLKTPLNFSDQPYFQDLLRTKSFSIGQYIKGRITGKPLVPFGYPVLDRRGKVTAVVFAPLDLSRVTKLEAEVDFQTPGDSFYVKLDNKGNVLSAYPASQLFETGHPLEASLFAKISSEKTGTFQAVGADGVERLYLFSPYRGPLNREGGYALLNIPTHGLFAEVNRQLATNLTVLLLVALLFLAIAWFGGNALIVRPVATLSEATKRLADGDLTARSGVASAEGEIGQLGRAFDEMAAELAHRQDESARMQEALRDAARNAEDEKAKTEAVIAAIGDGISIQDRDFRILYQNQVQKELVGDHVGEFCYAIYEGRQHVCDNCPLEVSFRDGQIHTEERAGTVNGQPIEVEITASPLRDGSGEIVAGIEVGRNIADRKRAERQLRKNFQMLSALRQIDQHILRGARVEESLEVVCNTVMEMGYRYCWIGLTEPDGTVRAVAARGVTLDDLAGAKVRWDDSPHGQGPSGTVIKTGMPLVCRDLSADSRFTPWRKTYENLGCRASASYPLKSRDERVFGVFHVYGEDAARFAPDGLHDLEIFAQQCAVTLETSRQWEAIRDAHQRLSFHVNRMPLGYIVWDREFRVAEWNPAAERIFGWTADEAAGKPPYGLIVPSSDEPHMEKAWATLVQGGEDSYSLNANVRKDGEIITCEWFNTPLRDSQGNVSAVLSMVHDVTEKTRLERQLQTAQRMEAVGTLAGGIAHDFNNALTGIFGFAEILKSRVAADEKALSEIGEILRCAERAATLTRQLLTYSRRQIISPVNLSLNHVITDLLKLVSKVVGEDIEIRTFLAKHLPTVRADTGQMEQVVMNLVLNARDAMPAGGQLLIETGTAELDEEYVRRHPYLRAGDYAVLAVSDTGAGMDAKTRERVFEPFFTTKAPDKGTGLGLSVVYGIVKQHNGFIHLYSEPGSGTTFKIYLPSVEAFPDALRSDEPVGASGGTETILLAEDDESVRSLSERTLKELGYTVLAARNGEEAVAVFDRHRERIDLVFLDVVMPVKGGKEAYEAMHKRKPGLKVLFTSGYTANAVHESFVLMAGVPFLPKPFGPAALARKVREVLGDG